MQLNEKILLLKYELAVSRPGNDKYFILNYM